ncbi:Endoplasmic reticulum oxidoreductin-1 [Striga hermonthica]|uniref:Endoplasmic reticulum oxidoreductin-1 n=1 Tax=Striga hermonthica TaxID=68872 RepID=A0A9N7MN89_STRHE|nr:Endoplasmic reticulum oxidoreductin-1 [Striga hermonthica]
MLARHFVTDPNSLISSRPDSSEAGDNAPSQFATPPGRPRLITTRRRPHSKFPFRAIFLDGFCGLSGFLTKYVHFWSCLGLPAMVEAAAVADGEDNWKKSKEGTKWKWAKLGAVLVAVVAIAMTSRHAQNQTSCSCSQDSRKYTGIVEDCCCDYETVDSLNGAVLYPLLQDLVKTPFFRYFKVKLWCDCPFWPDDGMCKLRDCSVCECPENEFPELFKKPMPRVLGSNELICQEEKPQAAVDRTLDSKVFRGWIEVDNPWTHEDETDNSEMTHVNLQLNPERYTGYTGPSARRIWDAVYSENCQKYSSGEICQEKRVLYKLISGLHSSISIHIASDYLLDEAKNLWGRNLELMYDRVLRYPDRVRNLYFTFMFVLRAVTKAANYLEQAEYDTGNINEDLKVQSLMRQLLDNPKLQSACPLPFDEAKLWQGKGGPELKLEIQKQFRNISALMDCVGCEKCRLWGKLQMLGLGTALKILFSVDGKSHPNEPLELQRNEVIALVNLLNRLSESVKHVNEIGPSIEQKVAPPRFISVNKRPPIKTLDTIDEEKAYSAAFSPSSRKMIDGEGYDRGQVSPFE